MCLFFFKQKTAYEMRISDWSSDVCSSDLLGALEGSGAPFLEGGDAFVVILGARHQRLHAEFRFEELIEAGGGGEVELALGHAQRQRRRSEEHTSELQSLMRISYAVFCL